LKKKVTPVFFVSNYGHEDRNLLAWHYGIKSRSESRQN